MRTVTLSALFFILLLSACGGSTPNANTPNVNTNTAAKNTGDPLAVVTPTPPATTNNAPTLSPVYKAYCAAWVKRDAAALQRLYSTATLAKFARQMKADRETDIFAFLGEQVTTDLCDVRNERIDGDRALAEVRTRSYPNGVELVFVKENGEWKLTDQSTAIDSVKGSSTNSKTAKN